MLYVNNIFAHGKPRARLVFISWRTVTLYETQSIVKLVFEWSHVGCVHSGPDFPTGYASLSLGPQDPRGPPANCGMHRVNCRYCLLINSIHKHSSTNNSLIFIHLIRFCVDNARVFQRVFMNLNMTVGQAASRLWCRHTQSTLNASCVWWIVSIVTCELGESFDTHLIKG